MSAENYTFNKRKTFDMNAEKKHKQDLGLDIPKDYFSTSKASILAQTVQQQKQSKVVSMYRNVYMWSAVAVVALLFTLSVFNPFSSTLEEASDDILIASLLTEESNLDTFVDDFVNDELLTEDVFSE